MTLKRETAADGNNLPINYAEQLKKELAGLSGRISAPAGDRIRMVGSSGFALPNGQETETIEGVIVDFMSSNLFYDGPYNAANPSPPGCFAVGPEPTTLVPTMNSPNRQADTCATCPNNQFGSAGRGKACKNTRLIAIRSLDDASGETYILSIPPTSIKGFDQYVHTVAGRHRLPPAGVLTRIKLDKAVSYAAPQFEVVRPLTDDELPIAMEGRDSARARLSAEPDFSQYGQAQAAGRGGRGAPMGRR